MAISFMSYPLDPMPELNVVFVDLTKPLPLMLMLWMNEGIDNFGRFTQYKYEAGPEKEIILRYYVKDDAIVVHLVGEVIFTEGSIRRFVPYPSRLIVNVTIEFPEKVPDGTNPE